LTVPVNLDDRPDVVEARSMMAREVANLRLDYDDDGDD